MTKRRRKGLAEPAAPPPGVRPADPDADLPPADGERWRRPSGFPWPPLVLIGIVVVVSFVVIAVRDYGPTAGDGPRVVTDQAFVTAANEACVAAIPGLRPTATERDDIVTPEQIAVQSRTAAAGLAALAARLRTLPVAEDQRPAVEGWLADVDAYVVIGRTYADAVELGDPRKADPIGRSGDATQERADRFARANGIDECQLKAAFVAPKRRGGAF